MAQWTPSRLLHLRVLVAPESRDRFFAFLKRAIPEYEASGGLRIRLLQQREDPSQFIEVVEYSDEVAFAVDQVRMEEDERMRDLLREWREILDEAAVLETYDDVTPREWGEEKS